MPKIVIFEFSPTGIVHYEGDYDRLSILLPYYKDYPEIRPIILLRGPFERIKLMSSIYPFNSDIINIIGFNTNNGEALKKDFDGYVPLTHISNSDELEIKPEILNQSIIGSKSVVDTNMVSALENMIRICREKSIALFIINSPIFREANEPSGQAFPVEKISLDIIHRNHVNYFDFSSNPVFVDHPELFADKAHLNEKGASVFTKMITDILSKSIGLDAQNKDNNISLK